MQKFIPIKHSSLYTNSVGSVKIHFETWNNHLSYKTCLLCQEQMYLKRLCFEGYFSLVVPRACLWEKHLLMKDSLSLNTNVPDWMNLLHCEHSFQKQKKYFYVSLLYVACFAFKKSL